MTYQQRGIIRMYRTENCNMTIDFFTLRPDDEEKFDMDQPYQRGIVWGLKRKQNLIKSLLMGVPVPAIVTNDRFAARFTEPGYSQNRNWAYAIVDGKQRLSTVLGFMNNEFPCPAGWWDTEQDGLMVWWSELSKPNQRHFRNIPMAVAKGQFKTLAQEEELFNLINFGGLAQGEVDEDVMS